MWRVGIIYKTDQSGELVDITEYVKKVTINSTLNNSADNFTITLKNYYSGLARNKIFIIKDGIPRYAGIIMSEKHRYLPYEKVSTLQCSDFSKLFSHRTVNNVYKSDGQFSGNAKLIIQDIINKCMGGFTTNNLRDIDVNLDEDFKFVFTTVTRAIGKIFDFLPKRHWYIDPNLDMHSFKGYEKLGKKFTADNILDKPVYVEINADKAANILWLVGGVESQQDSISQEFIYNNTNRYFNLAYKVSEKPKPYINGEDKKIGFRGQIQGDEDYIIDNKEKVIYIPDWITLGETNNSFELVYNPIKQFIDVFQDKDDILIYGPYEKVIKNVSVDNRLASRRFARGEIAKSLPKRRTVKLQTIKESPTIGELWELDLKTIKEHLIGKFLVKSVELTLNESTNLGLSPCHRVTMEEVL